MSNEPLVSVVIPVFNGEQHLEACLKSVVEQTYPRIEVVISDQASTDRSVEVIRSFTDSRIRLLPKPTERLDLHGNWTRVVEASTGNLVKLVCQDDLLNPDCLSVQAQLLSDHPTAVLACGRRRIINEKDEVLIKSRGLGQLATSGTRLIDGSQLARACVRAGANLLGEPVNVLIRRSALPQPLFDPRWVYAIDIEFYLRCLQGERAVVDDRTLCSFRVSPRQLSAVLARKQAKELRVLFSELAVRYPDDVSSADVRVGQVRAQVLAQARRVLYWQMRTRASLADRGRASAVVGAPSRTTSS
jgi:glycosyltransferase involved in cell wall biosynthesis